MRSGRLRSHVSRQRLWGGRPSPRRVASGGAPSGWKPRFPPRGGEPVANPLELRRVKRAPGQAETLGVSTLGGLQASPRRDGECARGVASGVASGAARKAIPHSSRSGRRRPASPVGRIVTQEPRLTG